jgi:hypothetical protein
VRLQESYYYGTATRATNPIHTPREKLIVMPEWNGHYVAPFSSFPCNLCSTCSEDRDFVHRSHFLHTYYHVV